LAKFCIPNTYYDNGTTRPRTSHLGTNHPGTNRPGTKFRQTLLSAILYRCSFVLLSYDEL